MTDKTKMPLGLVYALQRMGKGDLTAIAEAWQILYGTEVDMTQPFDEIVTEIVTAVEVTYNIDMSET